MKAPTDRQKRMAKLALDGIGTDEIDRIMGLSHDQARRQLSRMERVYGSLEKAVSYQAEFRNWAVKSGVGPKMTETQLSILHSLSDGKNQTEAAAELSMPRQAVNYHCLRFVEYFGSIEAAIEDALGCVDESWDDDEPFGPVQRCKCGLAMPCNQCITNDYVYATLNGHRDDNHAVTPHAHSSSHQLYGKEGAGAAT